MKRANRMLLSLIGAVVPVIVACAYGSPYRFAKSGKVVDQESGQGIEGLEVRCSNATGGGWDECLTDVDGGFTLEYDECPSLIISDVDGAANGAYVEQTVPLCADCEPWIIPVTQEQ